MNKIPENIIESARVLYSDTLPYHNFNHALSAVSNGEKIIERCEKESVPIDGDVVRYALLFHDAGYHEDYKEKGYDSKEEYSAYLAEVTLNKFELDKEFISKVKNAILDTLLKANPTTNEGKAVRAADVAGMANDYESFLDVTKRIKKEAEILHKRPISWEEYRTKTREIFEYYLNQDLHLTSFDIDANGKFIVLEKIRANLDRLMAENEEVINS